MKKRTGSSGGNLPYIHYLTGFLGREDALPGLITRGEGIFLVGHYMLVAEELRAFCAWSGSKSGSESRAIAAAVQRTKDLAETFKVDEQTLADLSQRLEPELEALRRAYASISVVGTRGSGRSRARSTRAPSM